MAYLASCDDSLGKEVFLRQPPPPFDCDFASRERRDADTDEDWLPELRDIFSGNVHVMIDLTCDSEGECDAESSSGHPRSDSKTVPTTPRPIGALPSLFSRASQSKCQLSTADGHEWEQCEIPESPDAHPMSPSARVQGCRHSDGDTEIDGSVDEGHELAQQEQEQKWEESNSVGGGLLPSRQHDVPISVSTLQLLEPGTISEPQSADFVQDYCSQTQTASQILPPATEVACVESGSCISIQDITFLHVEGQRETVRGPEYLFVGKMWLQPGAGVSTELPRSYRREVAQKNRIATLRTRKRTGEVVQATRRKKVKQSQTVSGHVGALDHRRN